MCGLTGFWSSRIGSRAQANAVLERMNSALAHRGPDDSGTWLDLEAGVALGHRRLSIIDLSPEGHQPMSSASGRFVITYNGEVYNYQELRRELDAQGASPQYRGHSDTEVVLAAIEAWGLERAVSRFVGMFAFSLWDRRERKLHLVRDRLGIKPLFYGFAGSALVFGSELRPLTLHPDFEQRIDRDALAAFLASSCVPAPRSIYRSAFKMMPGSILTFTAPEARARTQIRYWSAAAVAAAGLRDPFTGSESEAADALDSELRRAVKLRMLADVPLGAFLSGGIDSSTVVALMQAQSERSVRTFSIGVHDPAYNEADAAAAVAKHLGTDHVELYVTPRDALEVIPILPELYDEPFSDPSQIPTYLVSKLARRDVTVALSGDGGDELFGGYNRHFWLPPLWSALKPVPKPVRRLLKDAVTAISPRAWDEFFARTHPFLPRKLHTRLPGQQLHKLATLLAASSVNAAYAALSSHWDGSVARGASAELPESEADPHFKSIAQHMMFRDLTRYLPDDILTKVDRASMAVGLEARVPIIDHRVVELAWRLPLSMKVRGLEGKRILRRVLSRYVPKELVDRPKMGFGVPLDAWLRGPLRDWAEDLLDAKRIEADGHLDPAPIRERWEEHLSGKRNWHQHLWDVLMFQAWRAKSGALSSHVPLKAAI